MRKSLKCPSENFTVETCIMGNFNSVVASKMIPCVIDSDQNIGNEIDAVGFLSCIKIDDVVSADSTVDGIPFDIGSKSFIFLVNRRSVFSRSAHLPPRHH